MIELIFALAVSANAIEVRSADTLSVDGRVYRLYDIDAPQPTAACTRERERAADTQAFVRELIANAQRVEIVRGYDPRGRQSWPRDHAGRRLADISIDGRDLGELLIERGRATVWNNYQTFDWCGRRTPSPNR